MASKDVSSQGALVGWKRQPTEHGCVLTIQLAASSRDFNDRNFDVVHLSMNERQLRSLARDLARAADDRGLLLWARPRRWKFW
jgi:hypothetical protein